MLLLTDGLDRDEGGHLAEAAAHLRRTAHQLVWLNPLLRYDGFEPRAAGVRALLPHVDRFLPVHNLASLADLGRALRATGAPRLRTTTMELQGERLIPADLQRTWEALNDPETLKACIAGCESLERDGDDALPRGGGRQGRPGQRALQGQAAADATCSRRRSYTISFEGQGGAAGFGKGSADVSLEPEGDAHAAALQRHGAGGRQAWRRSARG